ncbi:Protein TIC 22, chloroplastic [Porphyridium purpureum]|uniref:Protein TIC 22, chloroplastic n=1 Tax=Porphyridium purpureum TaxID=35688 RepID=A0A5J4Z7G8_PORPP|nr:Protein TIC 22, chloroplastic [Porphyridium purpureum]|eukprot:POR5122..scf295_1
MAFHVYSPVQVRRVAVGGDVSDVMLGHARHVVVPRRARMRMGAEKGEGAREGLKRGSGGRTLGDAQNAVGGGKAMAGVLGALVGLVLGHRLDRKVDLSKMVTAPLVPAANAVIRYSKMSVKEKLSQIAVFAVTNAAGQPYLANSDGENQVGLIFFSIDDAYKMQMEMHKNPSTADAKIFSMSLDKAFDMVRSEPQSSGIRGPNGKELSMVFRFYPDSEAMKAANDPLKKLRSLKKSFQGVPVFSARGLSIRKGGEMIKPFFFTMEDLNAAWNKMRRENGGVPSRPQVDIEDLLVLVSALEKYTGEHAEEQDAQLVTVGFVPSSRTLDYLKKSQTGSSRTARMHANPNAGEM